VDLNYRTNLLFPVPIHQFDVNGFDEIKNDLIDYAYDLKNKEPEGVLISNQGGWQSSDFSVNNEDDLLHSFIINCLAGFPVIDESFNIKVDAWININKPGNYNIKHNHPGVDLAGVLWIKCPKDCGNIVFDPPTAFQSHNEIKSYTDDFKNENNIYHSYYFNPTEGRILIFPSHLDHQVKENKSNEDRISLSFNIRLSSGRMKRRGRVSIPRDSLDVWSNKS
tara:strand:+ start:28 stop:693 length:666 start_codon:yes stop_codon:yes gene_type:complete